MSSAPLDQLNERLSPNVAGIVSRTTPIPSIALRAAEIQARQPRLVRADIGQISGYDPELEVLYGPPVGLQPLRAAVAETWNLAFGLGGGRLEGLPDGLQPQNVAACTGAAEALTLLFHCFAAGRTVALPRGHWENYTNGVELAGGRTVLVDFFDELGELDLEGLSRRLREDEVSLLVTNFPCNPTGAVLSAADAARLGEFLKTEGVLAIADEVYARLRFDGVAPSTLLAEAPGHVVAISSASKEYLLPGARVGYVVCARAELTDQVLRKLIRANTASPNVLGQRRLLDLMEPDLEDLRAGREPGLLSRIREEVGRRRELLLGVLEKHGFAAAGRAGHPPMGTIFLVASLPEWWSGDDESFCEAALEAACVSTVPGSAFGLPGTVRFSFGGMSAERIEQLDANLAELRSSLS